MRRLPLEGSVKMVYSMTGYGRARAVYPQREITVEIKSVNSRYFEYTSRMPRSYTQFDDQIKKTLASRIARGKVEVALTVQETAAGTGVVEVNQPLAQSYLLALRSLAEQLGVRDDITVSTLARFPDVVLTSRPEEDAGILWEQLSAPLDQALEHFLAMRAVEGEKLQEDILSRLSFLEQAVRQVEQDSAGRVNRYTERLYEKLKALLADRTVDEARILTEAAIFGDKTAVDEETVRLDSHIRQYREILAQGGPVGRKLDFLTQELNRETNTIGSKCQELEITRLVVDMKAEIEKIREQIQNLE